MGRHFQEDNLNKWFGRLKIKQVGCLETSVTNYSVTRCDIAERGQQLHRCESLKLRNTSACRTQSKCKNSVLCDAQLTSSVPTTSAWNHGRRNSPNPYTSLLTELFKWSTTMEEPTETYRITLRRRKYSLYGRNKDHKSKRLRNIIKSPPSLMFLCGAYTIAPFCQQIMNTDPTIPRIIFTTYIPSITEMSLLRSPRWYFNEPMKTNPCGATSGLDVVTSSRQSSVALFSTT